MTVVWVDGRVVLDGSRATVPALDHGLTVGDGVFETLKLVDGRPFALSRHLRRLHRSAELIGLATPDPGRIRAAVDELLAAVGRTAGRLRITVTAGAGPLGSERSASEPTLLLAAAPAGAWPDPIAVHTVPWTRNEHSAVAGAKTTSYAENVVALRAARQAGASEALLGNTRGLLCEGTGSNVLVVVGGQLITPPLSSGCLAGITRELLLQWAAEEGLAVAEADLPLAALAEVSALALLSSTRDVQPVQLLDGRELAPDGAIEAAVELFGRRAASDLDP